MSLIYTNKIYLILFLLLFLCWSTSELLGPVKWSRTKQGKTRDRGSIIIGAFIGTSGVALSLLLPFLLPTAAIPYQVAVFFAGIVLVCFGAAWRWYAILTLGQYFTATVVIQTGQPVVQHGPYKLIRHPSYSGVLLVILGFGFMIGNWISLITIFASLFVPLLYRITVEEQELLRHLGADYQEYMKRTKRLVPFVF